MLQGRKQNRGTASEMLGEEKCLPTHRSDQKKVLETSGQGPFPVRSCMPLLLSTSLLSPALLVPSSLSRVTQREDTMKGWSLQINISKSVLDEGRPELPEWSRWRRPHPTLHRGGRAAVGCCDPRLISHLEFSFCGTGERNDSNQPAPATLSPRSNTALRSLLWQKKPFASPPPSEPIRLGI